MSSFFTCHHSLLSVLCFHRTAQLLSLLLLLLCFTLQVATRPGFLSRDLLTSFFASLRFSSTYPSKFPDLALFSSLKARFYLVNSRVFFSTLEVNVSFTSSFSFFSFPIDTHPLSAPGFLGYTFFPWGFRTLPRLWFCYQRLAERSQAMNLFPKTYIIFQVLFPEGSIMLPRLLMFHGCFFFLLIF